MSTVFEAAAVCGAGGGGVARPRIIGFQTQIQAPMRGVDGVWWWWWWWW